MDEGSSGALVPAVKPEQRTSASVAGAVSSSQDPLAGDAAAVAAAAAAGVTEVDKDFLCPICMQTIKDAFLTACGHSFCYMCIITHLRNKSDCPCCSHFLTTKQLFPNFLLDKVRLLLLDFLFFCSRLLFSSVVAEIE